MNRLRDPLVVGGLILAALVAVIFTGITIRSALTSASVARGEARLQAGQLGAANASAADAINTVASEAAAEARGDAITLENSRAILNAPGAAAPVDPAAHAAGLHGLCRRPAYLRDQRCLQFTPAR